MIQSPQVLEWTAQGEAKGEAKGEQNLLLRALEKRYGAVSNDLLQLVRSTENLDRIHAWFDLVLETNSLNDFRQKAGI